MKSENDISQEKELALIKAKEYLGKTDFKVLPDYDFTEDDYTLEHYILKRKEARDFIRDNE